VKTIQSECPHCHRVITGVIDGNTRTCDFMPGYVEACQTAGLLCELRKAVMTLKAMDPSATVTRKRVQ
jgi:hypothetical protein